jgi:hypothetical protein
MSRYRVNTPQPSFSIEADSLDEATARAANGLPTFYPDKGDQLVQTETHEECGLVRRVHLVKASGKVQTGFAIYEEQSCVTAYRCHCCGKLHVTPVKATPGKCNCCEQIHP